MPAATNSHEPDREAEQSVGDRHRGLWKPERRADHHNGRAGEGGERRGDMRARTS
jgi:hypothetical protein